MVSLLVALGFGLCVLLSALALPTRTVVSASGRTLVERSTSSLVDKGTTLVHPDIQFNSSLSSLGALHDAWDIQCDRHVLPPDWTTPPNFHRVGDVIDCGRAIFSIGRGGDPLMPQVWTRQADWPYNSCGVYLVPGRQPARIGFARIEVSVIAHAIVRKCLAMRSNSIGGWVAIGGSFIVLLTGREVVTTF